MYSLLLGISGTLSDRYFIDNNINQKADKTTIQIDGKNSSLAVY